MSIGRSRTTIAFISPTILPFFFRKCLVYSKFIRLKRIEVDRILAFSPRPGSCRSRLLCAEAWSVPLLASWVIFTAKNIQGTSRIICSVKVGDTDVGALAGPGACDKHEASATCSAPLHSYAGQRDRCIKVEDYSTQAQSRPRDLKAGSPDSTACTWPKDEGAHNVKLNLAHVEVPVPPTWQNLGANVQHILVEKSELLSYIVSSKLHLPQASTYSRSTPGTLHSFTSMSA